MPRIPEVWGKNRFSTSKSSSVYMGTHTQIFTNIDTDAIIEADSK